MAESIETQIATSDERSITARRLPGGFAFAGTTIGFLFFVFLASAAFAADETGAIQVGGIERAYLAHIPDRVPKGAPAQIWDFFSATMRH